MDRPQKAFDPCLDTGEVGEGPVVEPFVETLEAEKADEVVIEETVVEAFVEAILEAAEGVETVRDIAAEGVMAVHDIAAEESRLYLRPLKESRNLLSNHLSRLYVIRPLKSRGCT